MARSGPQRIGLDVGGTSIKVGVYSSGGRQLRTERIPTSSWKGSFLESLERYVAEAAAPGADVGVALPGILSRDRSSAIFVEVLPELDGINLAEFCRKALPNHEVHFANDAECAALGLRAESPALGDDFLYLGLGTGLASAMILDGRPFLGSCGNALELGYAPQSDGGHLEGHIGVQGLLTAFAKTGQHIVPADISSALHAGTPAAETVREEIRTRLVPVLAQAVLTLDVRTIAIGGGNSPTDSTFFEMLTGEVRAAIPYGYYSDLVVRRVEASPFVAARGAAMLGA